MSDPPRIDMEAAREEARQVLFASVDDVLRATGTKPQAVDILIVNCSLFNPTPSLSGAPRRVPHRAGWLSAPKTTSAALGAERDASPPCPPLHTKVHLPATATALMPPTRAALPPPTPPQP